MSLTFLSSFETSNILHPDRTSQSFFTNWTLINCLIVIKPGKKLLYSLWCWTSLRTLSQTVARLAVRLYTEDRHLTDIGCFPSEYRRDCALMYLRITKSFLTSVNSVYRKLWLLLCIDIWWIHVYLSILQWFWTGGPWTPWGSVEPPQVIRHHCQKW